MPDIESKDVPPVASADAPVRAKADPKPEPAKAEAPAADARPMRDGKPLFTLEYWAATKRTEAWWVAAAKQSCAWGEGHELTEAEYDDAVKAAKTIEVR